MVIKRKKNGPVTVTINTRTGRQTMSTSQKSGNVRITHTTSNDGTRRRTTTTGYGDGWFNRTSTNLNKRQSKSKSGKGFLGKLFSSGTSRARTKSKVSNPPTVEVENNPETFSLTELLMAVWGLLIIIVFIKKYFF